MPAEEKALLIVDIFKGQKTKRYQECAWVYVPANMTAQFQPLNVTVNGPAKEVLKKTFEECMQSKYHPKLKQEAAFMTGNSSKAVDDEANAS